MAGSISGVVRRVLRRTRRRDPAGPAWRVRSRAADGVRAIAGRQVVHCLGDSHVDVFGSVVVPRVTFDVVKVTGATALGLANPNSRTNALVVFDRYLGRVPRGRVVVFMLGEVDAGYLVFDRSSRRGSSVEEELQTSFGAYRDYVGACVRRFGVRPVVSAAPLPSVESYATWGGLAGARQSVTASLAERTDATRRYNALLRTWCADAGFAFLDYEVDLVDPATGLLSDTFRYPDRIDNHYPPEAFAPVIERHLRRSLETLR